MHIHKGFSQFNRNILYCKYKTTRTAKCYISYLIETFCIVNFYNHTVIRLKYFNLIETFCIVNFNAYALFLQNTLI